MKIFSTFTLVLAALLAALVVAGCGEDSGGPSPEERAAKMDKAREGMMRQGPQNQAAVR